MSGPAVLLTASPGFGEATAHHEATSGMCAVTPGRWLAADPRRPFIYPPHLLASCAAAARAAGLEATALDAVAHELSAPAAAMRLVASPADVLAVLVSPGTAHADEHLLRLLRQARIRRKVLLFGPAAHFVAQAWLAEELADAALLGEPEAAFAEAVQRLAAGVLSGAIGAQALRPDRYDAAGLLTDLDSLPFPAWDLAPWRPYAAASLLSSRGCPAGCAYCGYTVAQGRAFRSQSAERAVAELAWLVETAQAATGGGAYGLRIQVRDPVFAHDRERAAAICHGILARGLKLSFACESRPEHFDDALLRLLAAAGCTAVKIGLESGDPVLLQRIGRAADPTAAGRAIAESQRVARTCSRLGVVCQVFVMAGLPGQDAASLAATRAIVAGLPAQCRVHARPYQHHPATGLPGPSAIVPDDALAELAAVQQPQGGILRRAWRRLARAAGGAETAREEEEETRPRSVAPPPFHPPTATISLAGTRVFLTGGAGFVGGHVARALVDAGARVVALARPGSSLAALDDLPVEIVRGDLREPRPWLDALHGCDLCFHIAALYGGADQADALYAVNVSATSALLAASAAAGVRRVLHTSTIGAVGRPVHPAALPDENTPLNLWNGASHYVRSKYLGELIGSDWNQVGLEVVIVSPTAPVGPGDRRPSATGRRIVAALAGELLPYPPGGINFIPVQDAAAGHLLAAVRGQPGRTYILGHREGNLSQAAFLRLVAEAAGRPIVASARRAADGSLPAAGAALPPGLTANPTRAILELGLPQSDLRQAFAAAVPWFGG